jgi:adenylate cyclase class 2
MKETEIKILGINEDEVEAKLLELGAEKTFDGLLKVRYLDTSDNEIKNRGELLRIRDFTGDFVEICFKSNKREENGCKVYDEVHLKADDFDEATKMFDKLGFKVSTYYEKKRKVFKLDNAEIVIDKYPEIEPFVEIEAEDSEKIEELINKLDLQDKERSLETINGLLKSRYPDTELNNLTF